MDLQFPRVKNLRRDKNTLEDVTFDTGTHQKLSRTLYLQKVYEGPLMSRIIPAGGSTGRESVEYYRKQMGLYWSQAYELKNRWSSWDLGIVSVFTGSIMAFFWYAQAFNNLSSRLFSDTGLNNNPMFGALGIFLVSAILFCFFISRNSDGINKKGNRLVKQDNWVHIPLQSEKIISNDFLEEKNKTAGMVPAVVVTDNLSLATT